MFRFINSGLKQSVKAIPNTFCHSPSLYKKASDDENDSKLSITPLIRYDHTFCIYQSFYDNPSYTHLETCNSLLERKNFLLELSLDPLKQWMNIANPNYQNNCLNNLRGFGSNIRIYRLINNDNGTVIKNKSKKKSLSFNKVKIESKNDMSPLKILRLVNSGLKQSPKTNTVPNYLSKSFPFKENVDNNDNKPTTKHGESLCTYKNFSNYVNLQKFGVLSEKTKLNTELPADKVELLNEKFIKNFPNIDHHFNWLLFLNKLFTNLENPKWIDNDQISLARTQLGTKLSQHSKVKVEPKESPIKSIEVNIEKSSTNEPLDNLKQLGHELNTKGLESVTKCDTVTGLQYWNCAAIFNYPPSQFNLGAHYELTGDLIAAEKWYRLAVTNGNHPDAAYNLAMLLNNKLDDLFKSEIIDLLHISANQGCLEALQCINEISNPP